MKFRNTIVWLLLAALLLTLCAGCGIPKTSEEQTPPVTAAGTEEPEQKPEKAQEPETTQEPEPVDYDAIYAPVLDETVSLIQNGFDGEKDYRYASNGVMEAARWGEAENTLQAVGYTILDVTGDGIPELFIGYVPDAENPKESNELFGGYGCAKGELQMFAEGWSRSRFQWMGENRFFDSGSGGAAHSGFGTYRVNADATELIWEDMYFTDDVPPSSVDITSESYVATGKLWLFHNTTGAWDRDTSEVLKISEEDFWKICEEDMAGCVQMPMTPLAEYAAEHPASPYPVTAAFFDDAGLKEGEYEDEGEKYPDIFQNAPYDAKIVFRAKERVKEFKVLSLELQDVDENGHAKFKTEPILDLYTLEADNPIAVPMSFPGDLPTNGISYLDENGEPLLFTVSVSGKDGSLELLPVK